MPGRVGTTGATMTVLQALPVPISPQGLVTAPTVLAVPQGSLTTAVISQAGGSGGHTPSPQVRRWQRPRVTTAPIAGEAELATSPKAHPGLNGLN